MRTPQNIRVHKNEGQLELVWDAQDVSRIPFRLVRQSCRCAACVDEFTGRQILDPASVPESIHPEEVSLAGNYALKIRWSDQHDTGLYTWTHLQQIAQAAENAGE